MFKWLKEWGEEVKDRFQVAVPGYFGGGWATNGVITNCATNQVMADTGPLPAGIYNISFVLASSVLSVPEWTSLEQRNANNDIILHSQSIATHNNIMTLQTLGSLKIGDCERLRIISKATWTATTQASIWYTRCFPLKRGQ